MIEESKEQDNNNSNVNPQDIHVNFQKNNSLEIDDSNVKKSNENDYNKSNNDKHFYEHVNNINNNNNNRNQYDRNNSNDKYNKDQERIKNYLEEDDNDLRPVHQKFQIPSNLKKTFITTALLFCLGAILIGVGFIDQLRGELIGVSIAMWTLGGILFIPGGYYAYQFYLAYKADGEQREEILANIPEL